MEMKTKTVCIYHADCLDGFASAYIVHSVMPEAEFVPGVYGNDPPDVAGALVYIVDFSYPRDVLLRMAERASRIVILDHHKTAKINLVNLPDNVEVVFDMDKSGARLTWEYFLPNNLVPKWVYQVEDRDLWRFALPGTREVTAALFSYPYDFDVWAEVTRQPYYLLAEAGEHLLRDHDQEVKKLLTHARFMRIGGIEVPVVNTIKKYASDVGSLLSIDKPFAATYFDTGNIREFSLRSSPDGVDVSLVAEMYGGGGHKHASGFRISIAEAQKLEL